jgi:hypothetical protein
MDNIGNNNRQQAICGDRYGQVYKKDIIDIHENYQSNIFIVLDYNK